MKLKKNLKIYQSQILIVIKNLRSIFFQHCTHFRFQNYICYSICFVWPPWFNKNFTTVNTSLLPPKIDLMYVAMTVCCLTEQWFSMDNITGYLKNTCNYGLNSVEINLYMSLLIIHKIKKKSISCNHIWSVSFHYIILIINCTYI